MEYESRHWWRSSVPTGFKNDKPRTVRRRAISESDYDRLKDLSNQGLSAKQLAIQFGCSPSCIKSTLKCIKSK